MGLFGPSRKPDSADYQAVRSGVHDARDFMKELKRWQAALGKYEGAANELLLLSTGMFATFGSAGSNTIESVRSGLAADFSAQVDAPCADWVTQYKAILPQYKALKRKGAKYVRSEDACAKAQAALVKLQQGPTAEEKRAKAHAAAEAKGQALEAARADLSYAAPQLRADVETLLRKRDELKLQLYSAFSVAATAMQSLADMRPSGVPYDPARPSPSSPAASAQHAYASSMGGSAQYGIMPSPGASYDAPPARGGSTGSYGPPPMATMPPPPANLGMGAPAPRGSGGGGYGDYPGVSYGSAGGGAGSAGVHLAHAHSGGRLQDSGEGMQPAGSYHSGYSVGSKPARYAGSMRYSDDAPGAAEYLHADARPAMV